MQPDTGRERSEREREVRDQIHYLTNGLREMVERVQDDLREPDKLLAAMQSAKRVLALFGGEDRYRSEREERLLNAAVGWYDHQCSATPCEHTDALRDVVACYRRSIVHA